MPTTARSPLPFKIMYANIVALWLHRHSVILNSTVLVYMIINGKGSPTGCGLHGYGLVSILYTYIGDIFALVSSVFQFVCFAVPIC